MTPNIGKIGSYRFFFYSHKPNEPPHVRVDREHFSAKFWLEPVSLSLNLGFSPIELRKIERIVNQKQKIFLEAWHEYFGD